jgi:hypothetical protein
MRQGQTPTKSEGQQQIFPPISSLLSSAEIDALKAAISDGLLKQMGWKMDEIRGRIMKGDYVIYRAGYANAIKKIVGTISNDPHPAGAGGILKSTVKRDEPA